MGQLPAEHLGIPELFGVFPPKRVESRMGKKAARRPPLNANRTRVPYMVLLNLRVPYMVLLRWRAVFRHSTKMQAFWALETIFIRFSTLKNLVFDTKIIIFGHSDILPRGTSCSTWQRSYLIMKKLASSVAYKNFSPRAPTLRSWFFPFRTNVLHIVVCSTHM